MKSELLQIPGIGKRMVVCLHKLGIYTLEDLKSSSPVDLYDRYCKLDDVYIDACVLYTYRLAVFYAKNDGNIDENLRWWHFKNE